MTMLKIAEVLQAYDVVHDDKDDGSCCEFAKMFPSLQQHG